MLTGFADRALGLTGGPLSLLRQPRRPTLQPLAGRGKTSATSLLCLDQALCDQLLRVLEL